MHKLELVHATTEACVKASSLTYVQLQPLTAFLAKLFTKFCRRSFSASFSYIKANMNANISFNQEY